MMDDVRITYPADNDALRFCQRCTFQLHCVWFWFEFTPSNLIWTVTASIASWVDFVRSKVLAHSQCKYGSEFSYKLCAATLCGVQRRPSPYGQMVISSRLTVVKMTLLPSVSQTSVPHSDTLPACHASPAENPALTESRQTAPSHCIAPPERN